MSGAVHNLKEMSGTQEEDNKLGEQATHVNLKLNGPDGDKVVFRMKRSANFKKLMNAYCDLKSVHFHSIVFIFCGRYLHPFHTPDKLKMEDGDEIDAFFKIPRKDYDKDSS